MKKLFSKLNNNTCLNCGKDALWLIEYEHICNELNESGYIKNTTIADSQFKLICAECGSKFNARKSGMTYAIDIGLKPVRKIMKDFNPFQTR